MTSAHRRSRPAKPRFVDLFCGIGGIRLGFETAGAECVFSCDWDKYAQRTYKLNFGELPVGDIHEVRTAEIPQHEILTAGFPCQPFSISGVSKKNSLGRAHGFQDKTQGTLFFEIARIIRDKRPEAFLLENVKHLARHDGGRTFAVILGTLRQELGYQVHHRVIDAQGYVPQHRERIFIVGFRTPRPFEWPPQRTRTVRLRDVLETEHGEKYVLTTHLWNYLKEYARKHREAGNGFGYGLVGDDLEDGVTRTLSARYYKDGSEILVLRGGSRMRPRRLTPRECARLMGFPESFKIEVSDTQAYRQFGNSVVVPLVADVARQIVRSLRARASNQPTSSPRASQQTELLPA
jgi:DNA (cytosine-5)-methyltransferase 1